jgi:hypothetical protein
VHCHRQSPPTVIPAWPGAMESLSTTTSHCRSALWHGKQPTSTGLAWASESGKRTTKAETIS